MGKETAQKINKPRAIRRLVIWYKRNSAVTSIVDTAASSALAFEKDQIDKAKDYFVNALINSVNDDKDK